MARRVVVTGLGVVSPLGVGVEQSWRALLARTSAITRLPALKGLPCEVAAPVPRGASAGEFDPSTCSLLRAGDESSVASFAQFALAATAEALANAHIALPLADEVSHRVGVSVGSGIGRFEAPPPPTPSVVGALWPIALFFSHGCFPHTPHTYATHIPVLSLHMTRFFLLSNPPPPAP